MWTVCDPFFDLNSTLAPVSCYLPKTILGITLAKLFFRENTMEDRKRGLGALMPPGHEWEVGKTAASIAFVHEAERHMARSATDAATKKRLEDAIAQIKSGQIVLQDWLPVKNFLRNGFKTR